MHAGKTIFYWFHNNKTKKRRGGQFVIHVKHAGKVFMIVLHQIHFFWTKERTTTNMFN